jgi:hypothetical protein
MYKLMGIDPQGKLSHPQGCTAYVSRWPPGNVQSGGLLTEIMRGLEMRMILIAAWLVSSAQAVDPNAEMDGEHPDSGAARGKWASRRAGGPGGGAGLPSRGQAGWPRPATVKSSLWDLEAAKLEPEARTGRIAGNIRALAFSPDGRTLAVADGVPGVSGAVRLLDVVSAGSGGGLRAGQGRDRGNRLPPEGQLGVRRSHGTVRV